MLFETNQVDESVAILFRLLAKACNVILETDQIEKTDNLLSCWRVHAL